MKSAPFKCYIGEYLISMASYLPRSILTENTFLFDDFEEKKFFVWTFLFKLDILFSSLFFKYTYTVVVWN